MLKLHARRNSNTNTTSASGDEMMQEDSVLVGTSVQETQTRMGDRTRMRDGRVEELHAKIH